MDFLKGVLVGVLFAFYVIISACLALLGWNVMADYDVKNDATLSLISGSCRQYGFGIYLNDLRTSFIGSFAVYFPVFVAYLNNFVSYNISKGKNIKHLLQFKNKILQY